MFIDKDSVLYSQVRSRFDTECSKAPNEYREALEDVADIVGANIRNDSEKCRIVLDGTCTLTDAYEKMRSVAERKAEQERGKISCVCMSGKEAEEIILETFGIDGESENKGASAAPQASSVTSLFDLI